MEAAVGAVCYRGRKRREVAEVGGGEVNGLQQNG